MAGEIVRRIRYALLCGCAVSLAMLVGCDGGRGVSRPDAFGGGAFLVDAYPTWSRDGTQLAYVHRDPSGGTSGIYVVPVTGGVRSGAPTLVRAFDVSIADLPSSLSFAPDGRAIAFAFRLNLHVLDLEDGSERSWATERGVRIVDWHPSDETTILFVPAGFPFGDPDPGGIRLFDTNTWTDRRIETSTGVPLDGGPCAAWSPDGEAIAFSSNRADRTGLELFRFDMGSLAPIRLTDGAGSISEILSWWRGGEYLVFGRTYSRQYVAEVVESNGLGQFALPHPVYPTLPPLDVGYYFAVHPHEPYLAETKADAGAEYAFLRCRRLDRPGAPGTPITSQDDYDGD